MDPITLALLGTAGSAIFGAIGNAIAAGDYAKARQLRQQAIDQYGEDILPVIDKVMAQEVGDTAYNKVREDDSLRGKQVDVMNQLGDVYQQEGTTDADRAAMNLAGQAVAQRAGSDYEALRQNMARRGVGNSGLEAALESQAGQDATNALANQTGQNAVAARQRALQALLSSADVARGIRSDDYRLADARAGAQDSINRFNAMQRTGAANQNNANAFGMSAAKMGLANAKSAALNNLANDYTGGAQRTEQTYAGLGNAINTGAASGADYLQQDEMLKKLYGGGQ